MLLDRFGGPTGSYAADSGAPFADRSLPPSSIEHQYGSYRVLRPLPPEVEQGLAAPAFEQPGGGVQYYFPGGLQKYIDLGYLEVL